MKIRLLLVTKDVGSMHSDMGVVGTGCPSGLHHDYLTLDRTSVLPSILDRIAMATPQAPACL